MTDTRIVSIQAWLVQEVGYEHTTPITAWDKKHQAERHLEKLRAKPLPPLAIGYNIVKVPMHFTLGSRPPK